MFAKVFRYPFKEGLPKNSESFPSFSLRYQANDIGRLRVAVVVSKKVHKNATIRNRVKRKLLAHIEGKINKNKGIDLVFYLKRKALEVENMTDEIRSVLDLLEEI